MVPLHIVLSSGHRWNHPPLHQHAPPPVPPVDRVEVLSVFSFWQFTLLTLPLQNIEKRNAAPHTCSSARRHRYSKGSMGGPVRHVTATGIELAPA